MYLINLSGMASSGFAFVSDVSLFEVLKSAVQMSSLPDSLSLFDQPFFV